MTTKADKINEFVMFEEELQKLQMYNKKVIIDRAKDNCVRKFVA